MSLVQEYFELCKKYQEEYGKNTIVLMQVGSFMECYGLLNADAGSNIQELSKMCDLAIAEKNSNVVMAGFKDIMIEKYIRKIQEAGFTVVVYMQNIQGKVITRSLAGIFSPGTYFSNESDTLTNNVTCIWVDLIHNHLLLKGKYVVVGISNIDIYTGKTSIFQFKEVYLDSPTTYDELERFISIYRPSEAIILSNLEEIESVINYANISCKTIHKISLSSEGTNVERAKQCEKQVYQQEILKRFYPMENFEVFYQNFYENNVACQSFCFLLDFVYQHNPYLVNKITEPVFENCSERLILANHSLKQLNVIDSEHGHGKYSSVLKMLNMCVTPMGKRKFNEQFLNPTTNIEFLKREYDITEYLQKSEWKPNLTEIKDISKWKRQIFLKKITPKSISHLYKNITIILSLYENIQDDIIHSYLTANDPTIIFIKEYGENIKKHIDSYLDLEIAGSLDQTSHFETNFIKKEVDKTLDKKMEIIKESEEKIEAIRNYLGTLIEKDKTKSDYIKIHETEKNNFGIICTTRRCALLKEMLPVTETIVSLSFNERKFDFKISKTQFEYQKQSSTNQFITDPQIQKLCKNISSVKIELKDIITVVYQGFVQSLEKYQTQLESIIQFVSLMDVIFTKAFIANKYNYCKPIIKESTKSFICAKNIRHCLIEQLQTNEHYVSNDITLGNGITDGILLYGTNAVGKTSLIRSLGIAVIMAQSGLYVPCEAFEYFPYEYIFTRILGNDNIFKGLSTFAVEMSELRTILRLANKNSLILGDELCSGTEISSAISIFVSGIKKLYDKQCSFIFATHLHEITNYEEITALNTVALKHMSVVYDKERDLLVYDRKIKDGPGNNMYGLEVCKSLSLPEDFIEYAYSIRMKYQPESDSILSLKNSHYNSQKIMGKCELCNKNMGTEVHHLHHQKDANEKGIIKTKNSIFNKNNLANLLTLCEECHQKTHKKKIIHKKTKTDKGYLLLEE